MYAELGNRIIQISDAQIESYASRGYAIKNDNGEVIVAAPMSTADYAKALKKEQEKVAQLTAEIAELKAQIESLQTAEPAVKKTRKTKVTE